MREGGREGGREGEGGHGGGRGAVAASYACKPQCSALQLHQAVFHLRGHNGIKTIFVKVRWTGLARK